MAQQVKYNFSLARKLQDESLQSKEIAVFVKGNIEEIYKKTLELNGTYKYSAGNIAAIRIPLSKIPKLAALPSVERIEDNDMKLEPLNDQVVINSHALEVHNGWNLPQSYDGSGVIVGIIDEGIDFTHPDFRNLDGTTRLKYVWDQTIPGTTANPQPYGYGKEFVGGQIDTSTEHRDSPFGHGTHVAGTACGNGNALNNYKGVAPGADMIVVKMNLSTTDENFLSSLVDAVDYIYRKAALTNQPAVINVSLGTYYGTHDARDIQAQAIENIITAQNGRALVCAAGNAGLAPIHLGYQPNSDTSMTWFQYSGSSIYTIICGDSGNFENIHFAFGLDRVRPDYKLLANTNFTNVIQNLGVLIKDTLYSATGNRLGIVWSYGDYTYGTYSMEYIIFPDSSFNVVGADTSRYLWRLQSTGNGKIDAWSFNMIFDNLPDSVLFPPIRYYKKPDTEQTIVSSFTCSDKVITVGAYTNRNYYTNANFTVTSFPTLQPGEIWAQSSIGPTRDNRIKPDVTAPGDLLLSCATKEELPILIALEPGKVAAGKKHKRSSGTSMSSPVVCGIGALYFQRYPNASWLDLKNALITCADQDAYTGTALPDATWGYGKANAYSVIKNCFTTTDDLDNKQANLLCYPNPMNEYTSFRYDVNYLRTLTDEAIVIHDALGREIKRMPLNALSGEIRFDKKDLPGGVYMYSLVSKEKIVTSGRLVIL